MICKSIIVSGKVQGVGFRISALNLAHTLGVNGYVKNQPDGTVFIMVEGNEIQINKFIKWCYEGPSRSTISEVTITNVSHRGYSTFSIKQ